MSFQIIRLGGHLDPVVVVSPFGAKPGAEGNRLFEMQPDRGETEFREISEREAEMWFHGMADGCGFYWPPDIEFESLEAVAAWVTKERAAKGFHPMTPEEFEQLLARLAELGIPIEIVEE